MRQLITILILLSSISGFAKSTRLIGTVMELQTNEPIESASVYLTGTTIGTTTDSLGRFDFSVDIDSFDLEISSITYYGLRIKNIISNNNTLVLGTIYILKDTYGGLHIDGTKHIYNKKGKLKRIRGFHEDIPEQTEKRDYLNKRIIYLGVNNCINKSFQLNNTGDLITVNYSDFLQKSSDSKTPDSLLLGRESYLKIINKIKDTKEFSEFIKWAKEEEIVVSNEIVPIDRIVFYDNIPFDSLSINRSEFENKGLDSCIWINQLLSLSDNLISNNILYFSDLRDNIILATLKQTYSNDLDYTNNDMGRNLTFILKFDNEKITLINTIEMWLN
jgi:hypothetical protein